MVFFIINNIILFISIFLLVKVKNTINSNNKIKEEEKTIQERINKKLDEEKKIDDQISNISKRLHDYQDTLNNQKNIFDNSLSQYTELLDWKYKEEEKWYDDAIDAMKFAYNQMQDKMIEESNKIKEDLEQIRKTRASAQEALLKEQEIKEDMSFYSLKPSQNDMDDIQALERIKPKLHQPRILSMLIWSTYFQKPMTQLCNNVVGLKEVCGIYKITNQKTNQCYIGQSVDISKRWKDHVKCGLGIDTPTNNKLYQSMNEFGIWNFTFEILEKCSKDQLNEKESFYISLYQSNEFGFNSNAGIKNK